MPKEEQLREILTQLHQQIEEIHQLKEEVRQLKRMMHTEFHDVDERILKLEQA